MSAEFPMDVYRDEDYIAAGREVLDERLDAEVPTFTQIAGTGYGVIALDIHGRPWRLEESPTGPYWARMTTRASRLA